MAANGGTGLQIRLLGCFEVEIDGKPIPDERWPRRKTLALFKLLLTEPGRVFSVDQIVEALLPDTDPSPAASNIRARISELRRVLEPDLHRGSDSRFVIRSGEGYTFPADTDCWIDTRTFETLLSEGHTLAGDKQWEEAAVQFEAALALYRDEFLSEDRYAEWAESTRTHLRRQYLDGMGRLAACYAQLDRARDAVSCCQKVLAVDPCAEGVARELMGLLQDAGQQGQPGCEAS